MAIALRRARTEQAAFAAMGLPQPWSTLFAHELRLTWQVAKTAMDGLVAAHIRARLEPAERIARTLELRADILAGAIPPRPTEAAALRDEADGLRNNHHATAARDLDQYAVRAFSGKVEPGSPQKTRQTENLDHDPIQSDRIMV